MSNKENTKFLKKIFGDDYNVEELLKAQKEAKKDMNPRDARRNKKTN